MKFTPEFISQVQSSVDIVEYISEFVPLKKRGKNYLGLCPFHSEKTPSFSVSAEKQLYYCFGCGRGGSIVKFVEEYEKLSFPETVQKLAERGGIPIPKFSYEKENETSDIEEMYEVLKVAAKHFHDQLVHSTEGKFALEYLHKRGFTAETIRKFGLGYAPRNWEFLVGKFREENISFEFAEKAGLIRKREEGTYYDYFRGRALFPIFNTMGKVVGFGARKLYEDDSLGKYINSPETPVYSKSKILYGLNFSKDAIREKENVLLVEGYADYISLYQNGIENVVASSGTALTEEQIHLLSRFSRTITILYDADSAGSQATVRGVDLVLQNNLDVRIVQLPEGEDPDTYVRKFGSDEIEKKISGAVSFIEFVASVLEKQGKFSSPEGMTEAVRTLIRSIAKIPDGLKREFFMKHIAHQYNIRESTLMVEMEKLFPRQQSQRSYSPAKSIPEVTKENGAPKSPQKLSAAERDILRVMIEGDNDLVTYLVENVSVELLQTEAREIFSLLQEQFTEFHSINIQQILDAMQDEQNKRLLGEILFEKNTFSKRWEEFGREIPEANLEHLAYAAVISLRKQEVQGELERLQNILKFGGEEDTYTVLRKIQELKETLKSLDAQLGSQK